MLALLRRPKQKTLYLWVILAQVLLAEIPRGLVLATMPRYIGILVHGTTLSEQMMLGVAISLFSVGRLLASVPFGVMVDKTGSTRNTLLLACVISMVGWVLYAFAALMTAKVEVAITVLVIGCLAILFS